MKMSDATKMAVALARKGASDEVIALVMEAMAVPTQTAAHDTAQRKSVAEAPATPQQRGKKRGKLLHHGTGERRRTKCAMPLLVEIRRQVEINGPTEATARELCERHKEAWVQSRSHISNIFKPSARALAGVIGCAIKQDKGVVGGVRFTYLRSEVGRAGNPRAGGASAVYRVELA